jgi:hypothetical protein
MPPRLLATPDRRKIQPAWISSRERSMSRSYQIILAVLVILGFACPSAAQAPAPVGNWVAEDAANVSAVVMPNGDYFYRDRQTNLTGQWSWDPTGPSDGIITITRSAPTTTQTNHLSVQWLDGQRILVTDPTTNRRRIMIRQ